MSEIQANQELCVLQRPTRWSAVHPPDIGNPIWVSQKSLFSYILGVPTIVGKKKGTTEGFAQTAPTVS